MMENGSSKEKAQRVCAISYFKKHGKTPQQDEKSSFEPDELKLFDMVEAVGSIILPSKV
jgi:hypothetical protein